MLCEILTLSQVPGVQVPVLVALASGESQIEEERLMDGWVSSSWLVTLRGPVFGFGVLTVPGRQGLRHLLHSIMQDSWDFSQIWDFISFFWNPASHLHESRDNHECHEDAMGHGHRMPGSLEALSLGQLLVGMESGMPGVR